ncbi:MAG: SDR family NAD(P)-dependent oxidoreductase [Gammaproteobacteria bacterium]
MDRVSDWINRQSLSAKLKWANLCASGAVMLLSTLLLLGIQAAFFSASVIRQAQAQATMASENLSAAVLFGDQSAANEILAALRLVSDVRQALVYDRTAHLFAAYTREGAPPDAVAAALGETGAQVSYRRVDVTDAAQVTALLDAVRAEYGAIDGIVHLAGITRDRLIVNKGADEVAAVLAPKVAGLVNLDQASSGDALGFFLLFSSLAGVTGNPGQADYALANAFLDAYAGYRNSLVESGQRQGRTIAINWPLWADGGMQPAHGGASGPAAQLGLAPMDGASGMQVLAHAFTLADEQLMVMHGDVARIRAQVLATPSQAAQPELQSQPQQQPHPEQPAATLEHTIDLLKRTLAEGLKVAPHKIDPDTALDQYGVDSILSMELTTLLEKTFGQLPKTLFFEYLNVRDLAGYFISEHAATLQGMLADAAPADVPATVTTPPAAVPAPARATRLSPAPATRLERAAPEARTDIAIIGMAGRFPGARDLDEFWENLKRGQDNITEVPPERWDSTGFFDASGQASASSYCKWGGFMEGVDQFDPLFFNISPREAALIDPQERLFLETSWELMEGAGYTREALRTRFGSRVGVYVGAMYQQYHAMQSDAATEAVLSLASYSAIANRVSHFFGLQGPSLALDTMCSSAFTAIHLACESLRKGECEMAIAGGINLSIHPKKYVGLAQARIIGSSPASRSFANGDGYLPAEGVGAVLLKPLDQAERDGDIILAVIKGSAINHTGQTQHFGVPNPNAQAQLIAANFARTGIDPSTVSYVEAAANGSPLGDAIEMQALAKVFGASAGHGPARPIGSVKSNIGHAEAASGMSQLAKVILQMRHGQIAPTLQTDALNPNIRFDGSPFVLATQLAPWTRPVVTIDGAQQELARRAIINAFGAGGSNGHLLVEEYRDARAAGRRSAPADPRQVLLLSARSEASLQRMAHKLKSFLEEHDALALEDIAYTLQIGREAMDCRLALVVTSRAEAILGLERFLTGAEDGPGSRVPMFIGQNEDGQALRELFFGSIGENLAAALMRERHPDKLALYWAYGGTVDWALLHQEQDVRRVALPTYAFERQRYWVESGVASTPAAAPTRAPAPPFTDVAATLAALIGIGADQLKLNKPLAQYGVDSIGMMQLLAHLQAQGHAALEPAQLMACRTPQDIVALVGRQPAPAARRAASALATAWPQFPELVRLNGVSEGTPVFWFHAGMGGVEAYQGLAQRSARPFFGIQARGWGSARAPLQGVQAMAAYYTHIICQVWPEGPCDLGGYSLGGLLAYEVTRQLQELGRTVNSIVMLDSPDAHALRGSRISPKTHMLRALNTQLSALVGARLGGLDQILIHRDEVDGSGGDEAFLDALLGHPKLRRLERPAASLRTQVLQHVRAQSAYQLEQTVLAPLARPDEVRCYYFRNRGGVFLGALEPYFLASGDQDDVADNYWDEWTGLLPALSITDVDASNHMSLLAEERAFEPIARLCHALYAQDGAGGSAGAADPLVVEQDRI